MNDNSVNSIITSVKEPVYSYEVINTYAHDRDAFTQGLVYKDGYLYEGTGLNGKSSIRKVRLETGTVLQSKSIPKKYFGEGITIFDNKIIQLTWKAGTGFVYDIETFEKLEEFSYPVEGWGLTHDGRRLIMSDGTEYIHFLDPVKYKGIGKIKVHSAKGLVRNLNELEYIDGEIYANIWQTNVIARISPDDGRVLGWINLDGLLKPEDKTRETDVLNGIAYDSTSDRLFVTGKLWPKIFEIELVSER
jgi:glutamine cyclotransferase